MAKTEGNNGWTVIQNEFKQSKNKHYEGAFCQGNGYVSLRASFEEGLEDAEQGALYSREFKSVTTEKQHGSLSKWGTYIPTIMGNHPNLNQVIINLPYFLDFRISYDDEKLDMMHCCIKNFKRNLNLEDGTLTREFVWHTKKGDILQINYFRFPSMAQKHLFIQEINIDIIKGAGVLSIYSGIDGNVTTNGYNHFTSMKTSIKDDFIELTCDTDQNDTIMEISKTVSTIDEIAWNVVQEEKRIYQTVTISAKEGNSYKFEKRSAILTSRDLEKENLEERVEKLKIEIVKPIEEIYQSHKKIWMGYWEKSDIEIVGDEKAQQSFRMAIYHLIRSQQQGDSRVAICAKGFAGEAYYGRYFWDTEIFLLPFFLYTNPEAAKNLLVYRYNTLAGARENAKRYHCNGARYPWQSAVKGDEQCTLWEYADNEVHITADVAYAIWHYYKATEDGLFLKDYGAEILIETARFWADRVDRDRNGKYNLLNVMGPDEYSAMTRNNSFTNRMVAFNLEKANEVIEIIKTMGDDTYQEFTDKLKIIEDERSKWKKIALDLSVMIDAKTQVIQQSEDFEDYANIDIEGIWKDRTKPFGFYVAQEKLYRSKCLKQADSLALAMLFKNEFTLEQIKNTYYYYEPITTHDSSLSPVNHAMIAAWIDEKEDLNRFLQKAMKLDFDEEEGDAAEGIHIANCGCLWQFVVNGIAGINFAMMEEEPISSHTNLPSGWEKVGFKMTWKNKVYQVNVSSEGTTIKLIKMSKKG